MHFTNWAVVLPGRNVICINEHQSDFIFKSSFVIGKLPKFPLLIEHPIYITVTDFARDLRADSLDLPISSENWTRHNKNFECGQLGSDTERAKKKVVKVSQLFLFVLFI